MKVSEGLHLRVEGKIFIISWASSYETLYVQDGE